jgi:carbamoyltransferase
LRKLQFLHLLFILFFNMKILGISCYYHDSAAALVINGKIACAAQEERFTRKKHDSAFPNMAIKFCLEEAGIGPSDLDYVIFYDKPLLKFERILETYLAFAPRGFKNFMRSFPSWVKDKLFQRELLLKDLTNCLGCRSEWKEKLFFSEHHLSHAASAFFASPFDSAAVLTMDGVGEWATTSLAIGRGNQLEILKEIRFPHSLGLLYSAFTYYAGFKVNSGEYKLMGLAPYGSPIFADTIKKNLIDIRPDGSFKLNMHYFDYCTDMKMTNLKFDNLFGGKPREPEAKITQKEMDIAASIQEVTEEIILKLASSIRKTTDMKNLCLSGGVALNCVANGKLLDSQIFEKIWIQPASGDAGGALGAALAAEYLMLGRPRNCKDKDMMEGSYLGPSYTLDKIRESLLNEGAIFKEHSEKELINKTTKALIDGKAVGWFQGRMEFGPRALGSRSIIADPRPVGTQKQLNLKVKYRESFRPFAPSILREDLADWFDINTDSPYMLFVSKIKNKKRLKLSGKEEKLFGIKKLNVPKSVVPAVTHVDFSARIQTVHLETNPRFYKLIDSFKHATGCPILVNTSFNVRGEPIVCSPKDAFRCFMGTELDVLVIENFIIEKTLQSHLASANYKNEYDLD